MAKKATTLKDHPIFGIATLLTGIVADVESTGGVRENKEGFHFAKMAGGESYIAVLYLDVCKILERIPMVTKG